PASSAWARRALVVGAVVGLWLLLTPDLVRVVSTLPALSGDVTPALRAALGPETLRSQSPVLALVLTPVTWVTAPLLAGLTPQLSTASRLATLVLPLVLVLIHNEWVVRSQTRFEDATLERTRRDANNQVSAGVRRMTQARRQASPFRLHPTGCPEAAIIWKNLLLAHRTNLWTIIGLGVGGLTTAGIVVSRIGLPSWTIVIVMVGGLVGLAMAPMMAGHQWRNDLRSDLLRVEMIRAWPVVGWRLFAAEVAPPAIVATLYGSFAGGALVVAGVAAAHPTITDVVLLPPNLAATLGVSTVTLLALGLATVLPLVAAVASLSATLQNLVALLWPSWTQLGPRRTGSAAHIGQGLLTGLGLTLVMAVGFLPSAILVGGVLGTQLWLLELPFIAWELPVLGLLAALPVLAVAGGLVRLGGSLWDALDPSTELLGGTRGT
ncbi:MAG: hypothetical protein VYE68_10470, partial [Acidobacteriota bacterium]|nr:hypothetical protein [Acidobacteriota bacterium]